MQLPNGADSAVQKLKSQMELLDNATGISAAKALAEYAGPLTAVQKFHEGIERRQQWAIGTAASKALKDVLSRTETIGSAINIGSALNGVLSRTNAISSGINIGSAVGHSIFFTEFAAVRNAIGNVAGIEASKAIREAVKMESPYINELQKLQKVLQRQSIAISADAALQAKIPLNVGYQFTSSIVSEISSAFTAYQSTRNQVGNAIEALQLQAQRPHVLMDAYQRATGWLNPLRDIQQFKSISELEKYRSVVSAADPLKLYREALGAAVKNPFSVLESNRAIGQVFESLTRFRNVIDESSWDSDETMFVANEDVAPYSELAKVQLKEVALSSASIEALVGVFATTYQNLPNVRDKKIFATYIYPILVAVVFAWFNPYADFTVKQRLEVKEPNTVKEVRRAVRDNGVPQHVLASFRFVSSQSVTVRVNGRIRSPAIGTLRFGTAVEILKRDGDWSLIHYSNSDADVELQGWVLTRYLKKFR